MTVLKNGDIIFSISDALDYIDPEIADIIRTEQQEQKSEIDLLKSERVEVEQELEQERDHNHSLLCDIRENLETIIEYIETSKRMNKDQLIKRLNETWNIVNNEL